MVEKYNGEREPFNVDKVVASLRRSDATDEEVSEVLETLRDKLYDGITTEEIYGIALNTLDRIQASGTASKYKLREALYRLGPDGFAFEKFCGRVLKREGYTVHLNQVHQGTCIDHEVDVTAIGEDTSTLVECKFHNEQGIISHVHVPLYVKARFEDLQHVYDDVVLMTNTKFSDQAVRYANCQDRVSVVGWRYPHGHGLERRVEAVDAWPITLLDLDDGEVDRAFENGVVLLDDICSMDADAIVSQLHVRKDRAVSIQEMAEQRRSCL